METFIAETPGVETYMNITLPKLREPNYGTGATAPRRKLAKKRLAELNAE